MQLLQKFLKNLPERLKKFRASHRLTGAWSSSKSVTCSW